MSFEDLLNTSFVINLGNDEDGNSIVVKGQFLYEDDEKLLYINATVTGVGCDVSIPLE